MQTKPTVKISLERIYGYSCKTCKSEWTIADIPPNPPVICWQCGATHQGTPTIKLLYHCSCGACGHWWTIPDNPPPDDTIACTHCKTLNQVGPILNLDGPPNLPASENLKDQPTAAAKDDH